MNARTLSVIRPSSSSFRAAALLVLASACASTRHDVALEANESRPPRLDPQAQFELGLALENVALEPADWTAAAASSARSTSRPVGTRAPRRRVSRRPGTTSRS